MRTLSGERGGLYIIRPHAAARIAERFGVTGEAEQTLWLISQMGQATRLYCEMMAPYINAPRLLWCIGAAERGVRLVTDGNEVITAWMEGEPDRADETDETDGGEAA